MKRKEHLSFKFLADHTPDIIDVFDCDLKRIYINQIITAYTGQPADFFLGRHISENSYFGDYLGYIRELIEKSCKENKSLETEIQLNTAAGKRYFIVVVIPEISDNTVKKIFMVFRDVTETKNKEDQLNLISDKFYTAIDAMLYPVVLFTPVFNADKVVDFKYEYINDLGCKVNRMSKEFTIGKTLLDLFPVHIELGTFDAFVKVYETGIPFIDTVRYSGPTGAGNLEGFFTINAARIKGGLVITWQDISETLAVQDKIKKSEQRLFTAFNANPVGMILTTVDGKIVNINKRFRELFGYTKKEALGKTPAELHLFVEEEIQQKVESDIKHGEIISRNNAKIRSREGRILDVIFSSVPIKTDDTSNILLTLVDITKQKELETNLTISLQEKEVLLKEIHHRVKNNLQIVSSLLNIQAAVTESVEAKQIIEETQSRVQSIALMHENLYRNKSLAAIKLDDYLKEMVNRIHQTYSLPGTMIISSVEAPGINVDLKQCLSIGLIVNELITNCYKYAFKGKQRGTINIRAEKKDQTLYVTVADNGAGLPENFDISKAGTLGLQLVSILANQLNGKLTHRNNNGAEFTIEFPANS